MKTYIVQKEHILHNLSVLQKKAGEIPIWAVLKGNGYGLGTEPMAKVCLEAGISRFAVTELSEAEIIRRLCPKGEILLLRPTCDPAELSKAIALDVILTVGSLQDAAAANAAAVEAVAVACVHVKIDVGMGRYGFLPEEHKDILSVYRGHEHLAVTGIYTHFPCTFCKAKITFRQAEAFRQVLSALHEEGVETGVAHCCNSNAFLRFPQLHMDGVRLGSAILGRVKYKKDLRTVGHCETTVESLRWLPAGHATGYGSAWQAKRPTRIAVLPVGWYHGFAKEYGNDIFRFRDSLRQIFSALRCMIRPRKLYVTVNGKRCAVLGHVGMLHTVCDVTKVPCRPGDPAVMEISPVLLQGMDVEFR